jgi:hypothetical protein
MPEIVNSGKKDSVTDTEKPKIIIHVRTGIVVDVTKEGIFKENIPCVVRDYDMRTEDVAYHETIY